MALERYPVPIQTLYAELIDRAWAGDVGELLAAGGTPYTREVNGRLYWYWQPPSGPDGRRPARYVGPDSPQMRARIHTERDLAAIRRERLDMVRALRTVRAPTPDPLTGNVLAALSAAGAFRLRAVVVGSAAFQCYAPLLGVRIPASLSRTGDLDLGQFYSIALAVDDVIDADLLEVLRRADPRFEAVLAPTDTRKVMRYAIRVRNQEIFSLDVLTPLRGPTRPPLATLKALRGSAQLLRFLDYLLYREVSAVALHGPGIPINIPAPERYALHKLIVAQMRIETPASQAKRSKDLQQADSLIRILASDRPDDLEEAWRELRERGPSWRLKADRSVALLKEDTRSVLTDLTRKLNEEAGPKGGR